MGKEPSTVEQLEAAGGMLLESEGFVGPMWLGVMQGQYGFLAEAKHKNRSGVVMGGMLMTFVERAMGSTARAADATLSSQATMHMDADFINVVQVGEFVEITCEVVRQTKTAVFMRGTLSCAGRFVGTTSRIMENQETRHVKAVGSSTKATTRSSLIEGYLGALCDSLGTEKATRPE